MMNYKMRLLASLTALALLGLMLTGVLRAWPQTQVQEPTAKQPAQKENAASHNVREDEKTLRKQMESYSQAINKCDSKAALAFWTPDADYADDTGKVYKGREALHDLFGHCMKDAKGCKIRIQNHSLRFIRPDVALEDSSMKMNSPDGGTHNCRYSAVWVKADGKWLISSVRDLTAETPTAGPYRQLRELEWLVGEWKSADKERNVHIKVDWAANHSFLMMEHDALQPNGEALHISQRVGWDPAARQVRSWFFDSAGGFGEAFWKRDGNQWTIQVSGVLPDGRRGSSTNSYKFMDDNTCVWRSQNRQVDGLPTADVELKLVRVEKK